MLRQRIRRLVHHVAACVLDVPVELDARRLENSPGRLGQLGAGAVPGDECHAMRHSAADCMQRSLSRR
jgi:hypothetical protein